jgi:UPF0271 protein
MTVIDINCDMGESFGRWTLGNDEGVMPYITSANIAAGFHAGDPGHIRKTVDLAVANGVQVGAHVAFPDLMGFGRRRMAVQPADVRDYVAYQVGAVQAFATSAGTTVDHVKPHGAMYVMASEDEQLALAVAQGVADVDPAMSLFLLDTRFAPVTGPLGVTVVAEGFPDLQYDAEGHLIVENPKSAWDPELVARRAIDMVIEGLVERVNGQPLSLSVSTLCIHGDAPNAVDVARATRRRLTEAGITVRPVGRSTT